MVHLYSLSLQRPTGISHAAYGNFSAPKVNEFVVVRAAKVIELLRPDETGHMKVIYSTEVFGVIRSIAVFRVMGASRDYLMIGSDSGRLIAIEYDNVRGCFQKILQETFGRSGCRRVVPGQYVAVDPKGRVVMVAALEKQKLVYNLNRDENNKLTVSSPIEAHRSNTVVHSLCALEVGFDAPEFAALEVNHEDLDIGAQTEATKQVVFYSVDAQLNHVIRKKATTVPFSAHALIPLTDPNIPPGSVLVCCEDFILYMNSRNNNELSCALPRRAETPMDRQLLVSSFTTHRLKNNSTLILLQSDVGDIYSVSVSSSELSLSYFDSIPTASALAVSRAGQLLAACDVGDSYLFRVVALGHADAPSLSSSHENGPLAVCAFWPTPLRNLQKVDTLTSLAPLTQMAIEDTAGEGSAQITIAGGRGRRAFLKMLRYGCSTQEVAANALPGVASGIWTLKRKVGDANDYLIVVSFRDSTLVLEVGDSIEERDDTGLLLHARTILCTLLEDSTILQVHSNGWRVISSTGDVNTQQSRQVKPPREWRAPPQRPILAATCNGSQLILGLAGGQVQLFELDDLTGQLVEVAQKEMGTDITCLAIQPAIEGSRKAFFAAVGLSDNTVRLIHATGSRALRQLSGQALPPDGVADSLAFLPVTTKTLMYSIDSMTGQRAQDVLGDNAATDAGDGDMQPSREEHADETAGERLRAAGKTVTTTTWYLVVGCANGVLIKAVIDAVSGSITDLRSRFLGGASVRLQPIYSAATGSHALMALSSRPWLLSQSSSQSSSVDSIPLNCHSLDWVTSLSSNLSGRAYVGMGGGNLRIFLVDAEDTANSSVFSESRLALHFTPRGLISLPSPVALPDPTDEDDDEDHTMNVEDSNNQKSAACMTLLAVIEADHGAYDLGTQRDLRKALGSINLGDSIPANPDVVVLNASVNQIVKEEQATEESAAVTSNITSVDGVVNDPDGFRGSLIAAETKWGSCIRLVNPRMIGHSEEKATLSMIELEADAAALCCTSVVFEDFTSAPLLVVGVAMGLNLHTRTASSTVSPSCELRVYGVGVENDVITGKSKPTLHFLHSTPIEAPPTCMTSLHGRLIVGIGSARCIRMYSLGQKRLLRKCNFKGLAEGPAWIVASPGSDSRLFVGDLRESVVIMKYHLDINQFTIMAKDCLPRYCTAGDALDTLSCVSADKFGNIFVARLPADAVAAASSHQLLAANAKKDSATTSSQQQQHLHTDGLYLAGNCPNIEIQAQTFLGDIATSVKKTKLAPGAAECIVAGTIGGSLISFSPLTSKEDIDVLKNLELLLRQLGFDAMAHGSSVAAPLAGRDHAAYRAYFSPVHNVIDGDLCEIYNRLPAQQQQAIAAQLEKTPHELSKKLEDLRTKVL